MLSHSLYSHWCSRGVHRIVKSIDFPQPKANRHILPTSCHSENSGQGEDFCGTAQVLLEELGLSSQQFKTLFGNLPHGVALCKLVYDEKGEPTDFILVESNKVYDDIHSFKRARIGKRATAFNSKIKDDLVDWIGVYGRIAATGVPEQFETYCEPTDKWYQLYVYSLRRSYFVSVFTDVTKQRKKVAKELERQKRSEQQLIFSEEKYRRLYETSQDGIMARDVGGQMIDCNRAYAKMLGYTKKELRHMSVRKLLPEKWHKQRDEIVKHVLTTGRSVVFEREYKRKDGSVFPASVRTWRLTEGKGKAIGIWSIVRDISEQKAHQQNLEKQAEILESIIEERTKQLKDSERLAAIGQTAGMVGHDLRNPLQTVISELYLAQSDVATLPESDAKKNLQESIQVLEEQAAYMDKIVSDLQAFVRPTRIEKKPLVLKETVEAVLTSVVIPSNISVQVQFQGGVSKIEADPDLLKRVLINLVTNSVQAMPDGGKLRVNSQAAREGQVSITVEDTGVGIPEQIKPQIFAPLFTTKPRGQGFGLAVCKRVIEAHGGTISFESQEGKGAKFTIQIPTT